MQRMLFEDNRLCSVPPFRRGLLKWIGSKQRVAHEIVSYFPPDYGTYFEPFLGAGAVLATLSPGRGFASDAFKPLIEIWQMLRDDAEGLKSAYADRWHAMMGGDRVVEYERIKASYNARPNGADLLFLCRSCYGGVVRFRKADGYMSTPCGVHRPISPASFDERVDEWRRRIAGTEFQALDYATAMARAHSGDLIYCDPPYSHSQEILYGAQSFRLRHLLDVIAECKHRGVLVALSIDGTKRSGDLICDIPMPTALFEREILIDCGRSMLRRFQMPGQTLEGEVVADRLLLTY